MSGIDISRRSFLSVATTLAGGAVLNGRPGLAWMGDEGKADYSLTIATQPIELAPKRIVSVTAYNGQFPGPLLRFKEGERITVDVHNDTNTPEQLHWHGQSIPSEVDGAAEEGTPFIPPHGRQRISFIPRPSGFRFYHTHVRAGADLSLGQYSGLVGPVFIEPKRNPGRYDREVFLTLKEFQPTFSQGGDMDMDFLAPSAIVKDLKNAGANAMKASLAKGMAKGYEVGYDAFTINGRMLGHGEPVRVREGERVLFHVLNGSAGEIRSLALPGHRFRIVALDGNPVPNPADAPVLWLGTAERISAIVEMDHPGVWVMGGRRPPERDGRRHRICRSEGQATMDQAQTVSLGLCAVRQDERLACRARRNDRNDHRQAQCRAKGLQSVGAEWRGLFDGDDETGVHGA